MRAFKCPKCGTTTWGDMKHCPNCGAALYIVCPVCKATWRYIYRYKFCPSCGVRVIKEEKKVSTAKAPKRKGKK